MTDDYTDRLETLRDRAYRIAEHAKHDDDVPPERVAQLQDALRLIEAGWRTVETHDHPERVAPFDLDAKLEQWERQFDEREQELGIE